MGIEGLETELTKITYFIIDRDKYQDALAKGVDPLVDPEFKQYVREVEVEGYDAQTTQEELTIKAGPKPYKILRHQSS
ncbi:MAG: hypothetical protein WCW02_00810 [Candidatus Buchananbacteria bacterium]